MKILFTESAGRSLIEQAQYLYEQTHDPDKADAFLDEMENYITETLSRFPYLGHPCFTHAHYVPGEALRKFVYRHYAVLYTIRNQTIYILSIYRQNLPRL